MQQNETDPQQPESDIEQIPLGYASKLSFALVYTALFQRLIHLHSTNQDSRAYQLFYNTLSEFASLFDTKYINNCIAIDEDEELNKLPPDVARNQKYRLHKTQLARLMMRSGVAEKPDVLSVQEPKWNVPKDISELD